MTDEPDGQSTGTSSALRCADQRTGRARDLSSSPEPDPRAEDVTDLVNPYRLARTHPQDFAISIGEKGGTDRQLLNPPTVRRQSMRGFESRYVDIVDYIVRVTHRIWEEKEIGYIYDTYRHNCRVVDDSGLQYGRDKIVADTVQTINAFPDVRLYADEIVWSGDDRAGFHTSHRTVIVGHNTGYSKYGPPTGRKVVVWAIANCVALENEISQEHVIYNNSSLLLQLGFDLRQQARELGNRAIELVKPIDERFGEAERLMGQGTPPHLPEPARGEPVIEGLLRGLYHYVWNWRNLNKVDRAYAPTLRFHGPSGREFYGRGDYKSFVLSMIAAFPDLVLHIDDLYYMGNEADGYLTSVRWSAVGTHRGGGMYGAPTGRRVFLWGITQHRVAGGRVQEEWMMFNEFEVMQQILRDEPLAVG